MIDTLLVSSNNGVYATTNIGNSWRNLGPPYNPYYYTRKTVGLCYFNNSIFAGSINCIWKKNAEHANRMAKSLYEKIKGIPDIKFTQPVQSNGIFAIIPHRLIQPLMDKYFFYMWNEDNDEVRWMTSFDTQHEDIRGFADTIEKLLKSGISTRP